MQKQKITGEKIKIIYSKYALNPFVIVIGNGFKSEQH